MGTLNTNRERLVCHGAMGFVAPPEMGFGIDVDRDGHPFVLPRSGGITYNVKVGDPAFGWQGDHVEPCVSTLAHFDERTGTKNAGYNVLACIGNTAKVVSGDAKGALGVVTGHHGGAWRVMVDFADDVLENLAIDDKILVRTFGQGLMVTECPEVSFFNLDPGLLDRLGAKMRDGVLRVPVTKRVPGFLMGSGIGDANAAAGDYDITTSDPRVLEDLGLYSLKLGDLVALENCDNRFGRSYRTGTVSIGVVIHADSRIGGHGPGVSVIMSAETDALGFSLDSEANIANYLGIGRCR